MKEVKVGEVMKDFPHLFLRRQPAQGTILACSDHLVLKERRSHQLKVQLLHLKEFGFIACLTMNFGPCQCKSSTKKGELFLPVLHAPHEVSTRPLSPSLTYSEIRKL